jgi:hypothetical protein
MFFEKNEESFLKKEITLESNNDTIHKYFILRKKHNIESDETNLISQCFPGYPFFYQKNIYSILSRKSAENKPFFIYVTEFGNNYFKKQKKYFKNKNYLKKGNLNPYFLYTFDSYMKSNYYCFKNKFFNNTDNKKICSIWKESKNNSIQNKKHNYVTILGGNINLKFYGKSFITIVCFLTIIFSFKKKPTGIFTIIWNFFILLITAKIIPTLIFDKYFCNNKNKKIYFENNYKNIIYNIYIFWNGIFRSSNLFTI